MSIATGSAGVRIFSPAKSAGLKRGRTELEKWRMPLSQNPRHMKPAWAIRWASCWPRAVEQAQGLFRPVKQEGQAKGVDFGHKGGNRPLTVGGDIQAAVLEGLEHGHVITEAGTPQDIHGNAPATVCLERVRKTSGRLCAGVVHRDRMTKGQHNLGAGRQGKEKQGEEGQKNGFHASFVVNLAAKPGESRVWMSI